MVTLGWNGTETKALLPRLLKQQHISSYTCIPVLWPHNTLNNRAVNVVRGGKLRRAQRQMPSPHASFSGSCCSLHLTTQYRAQPQLDSVRDGTILVCVGVKEREEWWQGERKVCAVSAENQQGSVFHKHASYKGCLSGTTSLKRIAKIRILNCPGNNNA